MPRLKGLSGQDSCSVSQQTDIFVFIQYRHMAPSKPVNTHLDTHEREAFEILLNKKEGDPVYVLVQASKLVIKLILFPPYFFFIRVPLVFFKKIGPKIILVGSFLKRSFIKVSEQIKRKSEILFLLKEKIIGKLEAHVTLLKNNLDRLLEIFLNPFKKIGVKGTNFIKIGVTTFLTPFAKFKIKKIFSFSIPFFYPFKPLKKGGEMLASLSSYSKAILAKLLFKVGDRLGLIGGQISEKVTKLLKKTNLFIKRLKNPLEAIVKKTSPLLMSLVNKMSLKKLKKMPHFIEDSILPKVKQTAQLFVKIGHILNPTPFLAFIGQMQPLQFLGYLKTFKISKISYPLKKIKLPFVKEFLKGFVRDFLKKGKSIIFTFFNGIKKKVGFFFQKTKKRTVYFFNYFIKKAIELLRRVVLHMRGIFKTIKTSFRKVNKFLILFSKWCRIMVKFTCYLIKEIVRELHS